jgi:pimeloyl-ACP methyl ester carboxylesterase
VTGANSQVRYFPGRDGTELAWREVGDGRPLVMLHGLFGSGSELIGHRPIIALTELGYRVILPDLRSHGDSGGPHDPASYPLDVLADDGLALIDHLRLDDYDLAGYSMGGRLVLRLLARGARPARAVAAGQGLDALDPGTSRTGGYRSILTAMAKGRELEPDSQEAALAAWITQSGVDPVAVLHVLDTFVATPQETLRQVPTPTLILVGDQDSRGATAGALAALFPNGQLTQVPGDHATALDAPEFTTALATFLKS